MDERTDAMHCYDCLAEDRTTTAAAVCIRCGAGLCRDHALPDPKSVHQLTGTGPAQREVRARRLTCGQCHAAEHQR